MEVYTRTTGLRRVVKYLSLHHVLVLLCWASSASGTYLQESFADITNEGVFNHMVIDRWTGKVYVGAVNRLYQLSDTLGLEKSLTTGPKSDSPNCPPDISSECDYPKKTTHSYNKALLIDYKNSRLIACTNLYSGHCEKLLLSDLNIKDPISWQPMVPSDETSSVAMFIAPGYPNPASTMTLYVGATRSTKGETAFKDLLPSVCSRNLHDFQLVFDDNLVASKMEIEGQQRDTFRVEYVYGFGSKDFSYFLTVQKESVASDNYATRIVRVCQGDEKFNSYVEISLECSHNGTDYNILRAATVSHAGAELARNLVLSDIPPQTDMEHVLFAVFSKSRPSSRDPEPDSVVCVYPMKDIRREFTETIIRCFEGQDNIGPSHFVLPQQCLGVALEITDSYCGEYDFNKPITGSQPISEEAVIRFPNASLTAVSIAVTSNYTVALLGTDNGRLKKVVIENKTSAFEYETLVIDEGSPVSADLALSDSGDHAYVMTEKKVTRVKLHDCGQYASCDSCLASRDPFCGWCALESKCSLRSECQDAAKHLHWLPYKDAQCTRILHILPNQMQVPEQVKQLRLTVQYLPLLSGSSRYLCTFSGHGVTRTTQVSMEMTSVGANTTLQCETPIRHLLPPIPTGKDHIVMKLSLRRDEQDFVSTNFTFFDCSLHESCTGCTDSNYPCTWCVRSHTCTHNRESCGSDILVTGKHVHGPSDRVGPGSCPRIENSHTEILVPSGKTFNVSVRAFNLQDFQSDFRCLISTKPRREVSALLSGNRIQCAAIKFEYPGDTRARIVPFQITWGPQRRPLDNPDAIKVVVYKCSAMASSCGRCLVLDARYNCGWCTTASGSDSSCDIREQCQGPVEWRDSSQHCPNPVIDSFQPASGPTQGGTNVTISGRNLGKMIEDVENGITVAGVRCRPHQNLYEAASEIVCLTDASTKTRSGPVIVSVNDDDHVGESTGVFSFVTPSISGVSPQIGPKSGGSLLTISGSHLDSGSTSSVTIGNDLPCTILPTSVQPTLIVCLTPFLSSESQVNAPIRMRIDNAAFRSRSKFTYLEDPQILSVYPVRGTLSGGSTVTITGTNLHAIQAPKMVVYYKNEEYINNCTVQSENVTLCETPSLVDLLSRVRRAAEPSAEITSLSYGFIMDNVTSLRNYSAQNGQEFTVYPDPTFVPFEGLVKRFFAEKNDDLLINGDHLDLVFNEMNILVTIGGRPCNVTQLSETLLTCTPPPDMVRTGDSHPVVVLVGGKSVSLGELQVEAPVEQSAFNLYAIIGIAAAAAVLLAIILAIVIAYRLQSRESDRVLKRMQNQMDILESKVAKECKEAFAELQTEVTDLTSDLGGMSGIPFRDYRSFTMRVLFPTVPENDHPVTRPYEYEHDQYEQGLQKFNTLIGNRIFLLNFIRTLENSKDFVARDKVNVASLLSCALQNRMEYQTEILKTLLSELIERAMEGRGTPPKILLRRTESVAEKMLTNWFTFLLFKFLKECAGQPLFLIYRAVKQQINKGPVDALTGEARYSLSEDKLIRQQVEYHTMTINVKEMDRRQFSIQQHAVKVLDCDTISQVKEKILDSIHKNAPFSCRPSKDDLDLEWITGAQASLILQDEDRTSKQEGEFRRLNTLAHYKVPDGAYMALQMKQIANTQQHNSSNQGMRYGDSYDSYNTSSPSLSRSMSPTAISINVDRGKNYHLVKDHDSENMHRGGGDRSSKMVSEIYLTRLLATKGTLQQFVDDLFETIFSTANRSCSLPLAIKYMFDFLDDQALLHGVTDPETVHTWKSNSLPLRFWVNIVKNPDFVFDMHKSNIVDSCLSVVAQIFMDSCCMSKHQLSKDSPSSKLLYAKDIPKYKKWVERYYQDVKLMPAISDQDMNTMLAEESRTHQNEFNLNAALYELYQYVRKYYDEMLISLEEDEFAKQYRLVSRLEQVSMLMTRDSNA